MVYDTSTPKWSFDAKRISDEKVVMRLKASKAVNKNRRGKGRGSPNSN